jgi:hypothetical protein
VTPEELFKLTWGLYERMRRGEGVRLINAKACSIGDWVPKIHWCHENVDFWIRHNPQDKKVNGFMYFDQYAVVGIALFNAHCVVEVEDGSLVDITPHEAEGSYLFLRHTSTEELFDEVATVGQFSCPLP